MGKRSNFERVPRDFYPTPYEAVVPLLDHLEPATWYVEPCAGDGALIRHLFQHGHICLGASDVEPRAEGIDMADVMDADLGHADCFITNPPWDRKILHPIIEHMIGMGPAWLLFDADWMHTKQAAPYLRHLEKVVSIGRVKWIPDSNMTGKDNCCWYLFVPEVVGSTKFVGRK